MISSISISKSLSGLGIGGIVTQQISASVYADFSFGKGGSVKVVGFDGLPTFYIDNQNRTEDTVSFTAYDRCRKLSKPFDYSSLKDGDKVDENGNPIYKTVNAPDLAAAAAAQCGFSEVLNTSEILIDTVSADFYKGNSCNGILENLAAASGCFVCCDYSDNLRFQRIGSGFSSSGAYENSAVIVYPECSYSRLIVSGDKSEIYDIGSGNAENIIEISNPLINKSRAQALAARLFENRAFKYIPVNINAVISGNIDPYGAVIVGDVPYTVTNISINLCADGAVASLSAPQMPESSSVYNSLLTRQINQRVAANRVYGCTSINASNGLEFVSGNDEKYGFNTFAGGLTKFGGAMLDSVMPDLVETISETGTAVEQRIVYGGKTYTLKYAKDGTKKSNISFTEVSAK